MVTITTDDITKIFIPLGAFIIAIFALFVNYNNARRQVRIGKIEEISEIILLLQEDYLKFYIAFHYLQSIKTEEQYYGIEHFVHKSNNDNIESLKNKTQEFKKTIARLEVIANSYIKNKKLKIKILTYCNMYKHLSYAVFSRVLVNAEQNYKDGFPTMKNLQVFIYKTQKKLIKEMGLGYKNLSHKKRIAYREKQFLIDVGIKDKNK